MTNVPEDKTETRAAGVASSTRCSCEDAASASRRSASSSSFVGSSRRSLARFSSFAAWASVWACARFIWRHPPRHRRGVEMICAPRRAASPIVSSNISKQTSQSASGVAKAPCLRAMASGSA